jgi:signal peptide peptidase SppA
MIDADLIHAMATPRLEDWLGVWCIEPNRALSLWAMLQGTDWLRHFQAFAESPQGHANESGVVMAQTSTGKSIAIVPIVGTLMKSRSSTGASTSTVMARRDIRAAARNPEVSGIMLAIDSPGGAVAGTGDLAEEVKRARKSKPVYAQIEDTGASAAYWIASQASRVYANNGTAMVGSIGTMLAVQKDTSGKVAVFTSGSLKAPGVSGELTDEQTAYMQSLVNGWQSQFGGAVKAARRLSEKQLDAVQSGAVYLAQTALDLKLIDGIQSTEQTLSELASAK